MDVKDRFVAACEYLKEYLRLKAPVDTGNLANRSIVVIYPDATHARIAIGGEPAPYAIYTNEPWISPRWNGKKNPNEHWVQQAIAEAKPTMQSLLSGTIDSEEYEELLLATMQRADYHVAELTEEKNVN